MKHICLYKPIAITPLQLIDRLRKQYPKYENVKLGYAGRLDPMAEGLVLVLVGEENKKRKSYEDLPKEYECEVLFGMATDTYDILGKITKSQTNYIQENVESSIKMLLPTFIGKHQQPYPPYSSQPVHGKPLYYWARENKLNEITIPTKEIEMYTVELLSQTKIQTKDLQIMITDRIEKVVGNFRQDEILALWHTFCKQNAEKTFSIFRFRISCSSGTYIRSFANTLGKKIQIPAIALSIKRTKIGNYT